MAQHIPLLGQTRLHNTPTKHVGFYPQCCLLEANDSALHRGGTTGTVAWMLIH